MQFDDEACVRAINAQMMVFAQQDFEATGKHVHRHIEQVPEQTRPQLIEAMRAALTAATE